ncbi:hypothetical protein K7G98_25690 [Saccharothrix sp. MB29]|nr:hypothetical protein [Saccharothrix sp. MB29]
MHTYMVDSGVARALVGGQPGPVRHQRGASLNPANLVLHRPAATPSTARRARATWWAATSGRRHPRRAEAEHATARPCRLCLHPDGRNGRHGSQADTAAPGRA